MKYFYPHLAAGLHSWIQISPSPVPSVPQNGNVCGSHQHGSLVREVFDIPRRCSKKREGGVGRTKTITASN